MTFHISKMVESKRAYRKHLAQLPVAEKLAMLDALRDRTLAIRRARVLRESKPGYAQESKNPP